MKTVKKQATEEKIFATQNQACCQNRVRRTQIKGGEKGNQLNGKISKDLNKHFTKEENSQMARNLINNEVLSSDGTIHLTEELNFVPRKKENETNKLCSSGMGITSENLFPGSRKEVCSIATNPTVFGVNQS